MKNDIPNARNVSVYSREVKRIDGNTPIIFNMRNFFTLIGTMITLFFGFYLLVVNPRINKSEKNYENMYKEQKVLNESFRTEITNLRLDVKGNTENIKNIQTTIIAKSK
jgi:uncharacterized membrane protein YgaE (UPF0421/DUF939 family)